MIAGMSRGGQAKPVKTHAIGTGVISDKRTAKQKMDDANGRAKNAQIKTADFAIGTSQPTQPPVDTQTIAERGGTLGGSQSTQKPIDTQTIAERGGGLGGDKATTPKTDTQTIAQRGGGLQSKGKKSVNPVIDKRSVKQKLKDAQTRRNS